MGHEARDRDVAPTSIDGMLRHCCLLASIMLPGRPGADFGHQLIHIEAYIADVDIRNVVTFKLTTKSIEALTQYHTEIYWVDAKAFVGTVNKFEYWTHVSALELESDGTGELLDGKSCEVKEQLLNLMDPLLIAKPALIED